MKKIHLPTDFSDNAYNAIEYAVQLFSEEKCSFHLLHTFTPTVLDADYLIYRAFIPDLEEYQKKPTDSPARNWLQGNLLVYFIKPQ